MQDTINTGQQKKDYRDLSNAMDEFKNELSDIQKTFYSTILNQEIDYPLPEPVIELVTVDDNYPILTKKSFSLVQGKQKSKKTVVLALMAVAFLRHCLTNDTTYFKGKLEGVILWFDCEQGESYAARTMKLILKLAGLDKSERLIYCDLREYTPTQRRELIKSGIESTENVVLVVIDGLVDLMNDFMEAAEAHQVITELLTYCSTYNIHIAGVLHQNKADKNARAHVGAIASQKCELEITTDVDANDRARSIVTCVNCRGLPFPEFAIRWDKGSLPCIDQDWQPGTDKRDVTNLRKYEKDKKIIEDIFKPPNSLTHSEAVSKFIELTKQSESTAKRQIKIFTEVHKVIEKTGDYYRKKIS